MVVSKEQLSVWYFDRRLLGRKIEKERRSCFEAQRAPGGGYRLIFVRQPARAIQRVVGLGTV